MKKISTRALLALILFECLVSSGSAYATDAQDLSIVAKINDIKYSNTATLDPKKEIAKLFADQTCYSTKHNLDKLKTIYADSYTNSDGFDKNTYLEMVQKTWDQYPSTTYSTLVKGSYIDGDYAIVQAQETAYGLTQDFVDNVKGHGVIESDSCTLYYLQKIGPNWKITSSSPIYENTSLKYGSAKTMNISLSAPSQVKSGDNYTATLYTAIPPHSVILGSITNESISYPQKTPKDVFRAVKRDGSLERVLKANSENHNEYAVASLGITKASVEENNKVNIGISGMAFILTRVNVVPQIVNTIQETNDKKADNEKDKHQ